ncbi:MAG: Verru_Chthon cassette protein D [Roseimicrobium sp.]
MIPFTVSSKHSRAKRRHASGFTLIEILVVMTIMMCLMAVSVGVANSWKAQKLSTEARMLSSQFAEVALLAQKDNYPVEVRFYMMPDGEGLGSPTAMRAVQVARLIGYDKETLKPKYRMLTEVRFFEDDIMLVEQAGYTTLHAQEPISPADEDDEIRGEKRPYRSFLFLPNGSTSLPRTPDAVFTLVKETEMSKDGQTLPPNYRSVILQPVTSKATMY